MVITNLQQINKVYLDSIIQPLIKNRLYCNEAQLQFDLAWAIRGGITVPNLEIRLEELTATGINYQNNKEVRLYTDIVVFDKNTKEFISIELKYKTRAYNGRLKTHGAYDLGCYDFLWDVKRNEILQKGKATLLMNNGKTKKDLQKAVHLGKLVNGFSIIVTNDPDYWNAHNGSKSCAREFFLSYEKTMQSCNWIGGSFYKNTWRDMPLNLAQNYTCNWSAPINNGTDFRYMIFDI